MLFSSSLLLPPTNLSLSNKALMLTYFSYMIAHFFLEMSMSAISLLLFLVSSSIFFSRIFLYLSVILLAVWLGSGVYPCLWASP